MLLTLLYWTDTSRPQKPDELDGEEYFFLSRNEMEKEIQNKRFVEFGEYKGNLYGTSIDAIKSVVNSGHVAILCPHPQVNTLIVFTIYCLRDHPLVLETINVMADQPLS